MGRRVLLFLTVLILLTTLMPESRIRAKEGDLAEKKRTVETQKILKLRIKMETEREEKILKAMGLKCERDDNADDSELSGSTSSPPRVRSRGRREAVCNATVNQMNQLKQAGIEFEVQREGIKIEKGGYGYKRVNKGKDGAYGENENNYWIPEGDWIYSPITENQK